MCRNCIKMIYKTYYFIEKCISSQRVLKQILLRESKMIESEKIQESIEVESKATDAKKESKSNIEDSTNDISTAGQWDDLPLESDNDTEVDDHAEIESKVSETEETTADTNLLSKINTIKEQISKIRNKNKVKLRQMAKAQLVDYKHLPKSNKRPYVFRKGKSIFSFTS